MPPDWAAFLQATASTSQQTGSIWTTLVEAAVAVATVVLLGTLLTRLVHRIVRRAGGSRSVTTSVTEWMGVITILAAVAVLSTVAGLSSYLTALTVSGIAGLAISLALQSTISNVIAGVLLQHDGVIRVGDDVQYGMGGVRGEVVKLSLRNTWLKTKDGVVVVLNNGSLSSGPVLNYTSMARVEAKLGE